MKFCKISLCLLCLGAFVLIPNMVNHSNVPKKMIKQNTHINPPNINKKSAYKLLFYIKNKHNFQGITFLNGYFYCSFDVGHGMGNIVKYDITGKKVSETKPMFLGHCASIAYRIKTNTIYIANGGGRNLTRIYIINYNKSKILDTLKYNNLGTSALLAIDNINNYLILHTVLHNGDFGNPTFTIINLANRKVIHSFSAVREGVPQGLETDGKHIYLYTNNKITVYNYKGTVLGKYSINKIGESEGIAIESRQTKSYLTVGFKSPNRIYEVR